jgi:hypothetical protein
MKEFATQVQRGKLHCNKFDQWVAAAAAECARPDDYCEFRERCGIYVLMTERTKGVNKKVKEEHNASL